MSNQSLRKLEAKRDIRDLIQSDRTKHQMALVLPKHLTADRMARVAVTAVMRTPKLLNCTPESLLNCLMQCSQLGLEPDGRRAHLIPFENRNTGVTDCTLIIDWKGLAELALRSGTIAKLHADLICDKDEFAYDLGEVLHHKINFREPRGEPYAAYAMAVTKTGEKFMQVMTKEEIEAVRNNSQGWKAFQKGYAKQSPWQDSPGEMWKKTVFRRLSKWLPLSPEYRDALDADDEPGVTIDTQLPDAPVFSAKPEPKQLEATEAETIPVEAAPKKRGKQAEPEPGPTPEPTPTLATSAAPESGESSEPPPYLATAMAAIETAGLTPDQVLQFYNQNNNANAKSLSDIPEARLSKMLGSGPIVESIRKVKVCPGAN